MQDWQFSHGAMIGARLHLMPYTLSRLLKPLLPVALLLGACAGPREEVPPAPRISWAVAAPSIGLPDASAATTTGDYRVDAASHLYAVNANRIYPGVMPPLLYAIGVLRLELDRAGQLTSLKWLRAPDHAPEVIAEIERTVRQAAPFPAPVHLAQPPSYTETWLWDASGRFQLHTLTEGQSYEGQTFGARPPPAGVDLLAASAH